MYEYLVELIGSAIFVYVILATGNPLIIGATLALILLNRHILNNIIDSCIYEKNIDIFNCI